MDNISAVEKIIRDANEKLATIAGPEFSLKLVRNEKQTTFLILKIEALKNIVSEEFGIPFDKIRSRTKTQDLVDARFAFCYLAKKLLNMTHMNIGLEIRRHHTSVTTALKVIRNHMEYEADLKYRVEYIEKKFYEDYHQTEA